LIACSFIAAAHNDRTAVCHPGLTFAVGHGNKQAMASRTSRRLRSTASSPKAQRKETAGSFVRFLLGVAIIAWVFRSFIAQPFYIPSASMLPTLYIGDYLVVAKWPYGYSRYSLPFDSPPFHGHVFGGLPNRGDVVVFHHPVEDADLIKRVIGLPGDLVAVANGEVILNGHALPRLKIAPVGVRISANSPCKMAPGAAPTIASKSPSQLCVYPAYLETLPGGPTYTILDQVDHGPADDFPATRVPAGHVFLLGDNRDDSLDSRYPTTEGGVGMLPAENLIGRATFTFWSTDGSASYLKPWTWFAALRASRVGNGYSGAAK
jgi:signal peptidase I